MSTKTNNLEILRHSASHVLAAAVLEMFPEAKFGIGPAIENGFYYDFDLPRTLIPEDLPLLEEKMRKIIQTNYPFKKQEIDSKKAVELFKKAKQPYKVELIKDLEKASTSSRQRRGSSRLAEAAANKNKYSLSNPPTGRASKGKTTVTFYKTGDFIDLCVGPHIDSTGEIKSDAFKLTKISGAYWKGDEKNKMLQRIYGTVWNSKKELDEYLHMLEEAEKRDHRKLGKELDLFVFSETIGKGLPLWTEKGTIIRRELERFIVDEEIKRGYKHVCTPDIAKIDLYKKSGHYPYYKDSMYAPITIDEEQFMLRPMSCPHHFELYLSKPHSYRELPMKIAELVKLYRYEKSGELTGLVRVRNFCLADAHIICADKNQAKQEITSALDLIEYATNILGLKMGTNYWYRLSLGDRKDEKKYFKDDKSWDEAEKILKEVLRERKCTFVETENEAAFYGPKIDIQMKNASGKEDTAFTVQYDFVMPKKFKLTYIDDKGKEKEAIVVHRSSIGCIERLIAFLIEHYAGNFPLWLSPVQVEIIPISEKFIDYAEKIEKQLKEKNIRASLNRADETLGKKIREAQKQKINYMLIVGEKEQSSKTISVRERTKGDMGTIQIDDFIKKIIAEIEKKI